MLKTLIAKLKTILNYNNQIKPSAAYDLWAGHYDDQTNNPLIYLNDKIFDRLISALPIEGKVVADIGCGTGRHWDKLFAKKPLSVIGCDVSKEMLNKLAAKYPGAKTYLTDGVSLNGIADNSCNLITCNLAIGYIQNLPAAFAEWVRILKDQGAIIIIDLHPTALLKGANRTFTHNKKVFRIENYIHSLEEIKNLAANSNYITAELIEKNVDESIRHFYEEANALNVYDKDYGTPILYGLLLKSKA